MSNIAPEKIYDIAHEIKSSSMLNKQHVFKEKYPEFAEKYPTLFGMCCDPNSDISKLDYLLNMLKNIQTDRMTQHVASVNVGQILFDEYVKPVVHNPQ
jgi:hypothetical protein